MMMKYKYSPSPLVVLPRNSLKPSRNRTLRVRLEILLEQRIAGAGVGADVLRREGGEFARLGVSE